MNIQKIDLILDNTYMASVQDFRTNLLQEGNTYGLESGERFITESVLKLRGLLVEEGIIQNVRDNLAGYATAAGLGAGGMYLYNNPDVMQQLNPLVAQGADDNALAPTAPALAPDGTPLAESTNFYDEINESTGLNIFEEAIMEVLPLVLENTSESLKTKLIARTIMENGSINLEEADFLCNIVNKFITEATDEFIPDEIDVSDEDDESLNDDGTIQLYDADGNAYVYANGALTPAGVDMGAADDGAGSVDGDGDVDAAGLPDVDADMTGAIPTDMGTDDAAGDAAVVGADADDGDGDVDPAGMPDADAEAGIDPSAPDGVTDPTDPDVDGDAGTDVDNDGDAASAHAAAASAHANAASAHAAAAGALNESTLLTESSDVVNRILAKMNY